MTYSPMELAEAYLKTGELDYALDALNEHLSVQHDDDTARRLRVQVLLRQADTSSLQTALADSAALAEKDSDDWQRLSVIYERLGQVETAIDTLRQALISAPDTERLIERLLALLLQTQAYEAALHLVREQPRTWRWLEREGDLLALMGDDMLATARYGLVLAQLEDFRAQMSPAYWDALRARVLLARANAYQRLGHFSPARAHYQDAQNLLQDDASIAFNLSLTDYLANDNRDHALVQCRAAFERLSPMVRATIRADLNAHPRYNDFLSNFD